MNRSLANVILGGYSTTVTAKVQGEALQHQEVDVAGAVDALTNARSIIIVSHSIFNILFWLLSLAATDVLTDARGFTGVSQGCSAGMAAEAGWAAGPVLAQANCLHLSADGHWGFWG